MENKFFISEKPANSEDAQGSKEVNEETGRPKIFVSETTEKKDGAANEPITVDKETGRPELFIDEKTEQAGNAETEPIKMNKETGMPELFIDEETKEQE